MLDQFFRFLILELRAQFYLRFSNPTREWPARSVQQLIYELGRHSMNGVQIEAPFEHARAFDVHSDC